MSKGNQIIGLRADPDLLRRIDTYIEQLKATYPGFVVGRAGVVRDFVVKGLDAAWGAKAAGAPLPRPAEVAVAPAAPAPAPAPATAPAPRAPKPPKPSRGLVPGLAPAPPPPDRNPVKAPPSPSAAKKLTPLPEGTQVTRLPGPKEPPVKVVAPPPPAPAKAKGGMPAAVVMEEIAKVKVSNEVKADLISVVLMLDELLELSGRVPLDRIRKDETINQMDREKVDAALVQMMQQGLIHLLPKLEGPLPKPDAALVIDRPYWFVEVQPAGRNFYDRSLDGYFGDYTPPHLRKRGRR